MTLHSSRWPAEPTKLTAAFPLLSAVTLGFVPAARYQPAFAQFAGPVVVASQNDSWPLPLLTAMIALPFVISAMLGLVLDATTTLDSKHFEAPPEVT